MRCLGESPDNEGGAVLEIFGRTEDAVDCVVVEESYLSPESLARLVGRLASTTRGEQFLFREVEMDCLFREVDGELAGAVLAGASPGVIDRLRRIRALVFDAHDLVGVEDTEQAIERLKAVSEEQRSVEAVARVRED